MIIDFKKYKKVSRLDYEALTRKNKQKQQGIAEAIQPLTDVLKASVVPALPCQLLKPDDYK